MATEATNGAAAAGETNGASAEKTVTFSALKPHLFVECGKANDAVSFYKAAFGAEEVNRVSHQKRKADQELPLLLSAEIKLGSSVVIISDLSDDPTAVVKTGVSGMVFCLETEDIAAAIDKAVKAGAVAQGELSEGEGACCGARVAQVKDPYGIVWLICTAAKKCANVEA